MSYHPWHHLGSLRHITFAITRLPAGRAWWLPQDQAIVLDDRLSRVQRRCALAHELIHAERDHRECVSAVLTTRQEVGVSREAARRLITVDALVDGLLWAGWDDHGLADHLDVDLETLHCRVTSLSARERHAVDTRWREAERAIP